MGYLETAFGGIKMKKILLASLIALGVISCLLSACSAAQQSKISQYDQICSGSNNISPEFPQFLDIVWPPPGTTLDSTSYSQRSLSETAHSRGVGIALWRDIDTPPDTEIASLIARSSLLVDGRSITKDSLAAADGLTYKVEYDANGQVLDRIPTGPLYLSWTPALDTGKHQARFTVKKNSGEILEYTWCFTVTK
jgi:hypothetical protein